jgi:hypothetical protein
MRSSKKSTIDLDNDGFKTIFDHFRNTHARDLTLDHILPESRGGQTRLTMRSGFVRAATLPRATGGSMSGMV